MLNSIKNPKSKIQNRLQSTIQHPKFTIRLLLAPIHHSKSNIQNPIHPANPVLLSKIHPKFKIQNPKFFFLPPSNKCAQIAKEWLDKGLAKCHEIAMLYPSSRNSPKPPRGPVAGPATPLS